MSAPLPSSSSPRSVSVALCTLNGSTYLPNQLNSILAQTAPPTELVAFDDGSTDDTVQILRRFATAAPFPVHVRVNEQRLGPAANFACAIAAATGSIIALCDQDDLWHPDRLAVTRTAFEADPTLGLLFSDAEMCDAAGQPLGYRLWDSLHFPPRLRTRVQTHGFEVLLRQNVVTGATMAFDAKYRSLLLPVPPLWMHDGWIALLISAVAPVRAIDRPLIRYRQHAQQAVGALRRSLLQQVRNARAMHRDAFEEEAARYAAALDRLTGFPQVPAEHLKQLRAKVHHLQRRSRIRRREIARVLPSVAELVTGRYQHFSLGWKSFAQDLLL